MAKLLKVISLGAALVLVAFGIWKTQIQNSEKWVVYERYPNGIMGTSCHLAVVMDYRKGEEAERILDQAEYQLRYVESLASNWISDSEISKFNQAEEGYLGSFSNVNWEIIQQGLVYYKLTNGAFDMTCRPLISLWKQAGKDHQLPSLEEINHARISSSWDMLEILESKHIRKKSSTVRLDLGGIAKGYAIDLAVDAMREQGAIGGLVDVGGDIRVFGKSNRDDYSWSIQVKDPFDSGSFRKVLLSGNNAICTSGNYARYVEIEGKKYSHIIHPQTGYPTDLVPSVTVIASDTLIADVWATSLSVMGPAGLKLLPDGVNAMLVYQTEKGLEFFETDGFSMLSDFSEVNETESM